MRKLSLTIADDTDIPALLETVRHDLSAAGLSDSEREELAARVSAGVEDFARRGRELAALGSQFKSRQVITLPHSRATICAYFGGARPSLTERVARLLFGG